MPLPSKSLTIISATIVCAVAIYFNYSTFIPQIEQTPAPQLHDGKDLSQIVISAESPIALKYSHSTEKQNAPVETTTEINEKSLESSIKTGKLSIPGNTDTISKAASSLTAEQPESEQTTAHWAFEKETYYINLFSENESLSGFVLSEARCEGRECKLSFLLEDEQQRDAITNKLMEKLMSQPEDLNVAFDLNTPRHEAVLYIKSGTVN